MDFVENIHDVPWIFDLMNIQFPKKTFCPLTLLLHFFGLNAYLF